LSGRLANWAIELGGLEIEIKGRNVVKGQVVADFVAETPEGARIEDSDCLIEIVPRRKVCGSFKQRAHHARRGPV
jgi:hypothetical protein